VSKEVVSRSKTTDQVLILVAIGISLLLFVWHILALRSIFRLFMAFEESLFTTCITFTFWFIVSLIPLGTILIWYNVLRKKSAQDDSILEPLLRNLSILLFTIGGILLVLGLPMFVSCSIYGCDFYDKIFFVGGTPPFILSLVFRAVGETNNHENKK
jgi:glucan phosphoethanolaminetransferase (alkaline phosphatase superfamily)